MKNIFIIPIRHTNLIVPMRNSIQKAFSCRRFTSTIESDLAKRFKLAVNEDDSVLPPSEIVRRACGVDVIDLRYPSLDNASLIPHIGSAAHESRNAMRWLLIRGIEAEALNAGHTPANLLS